jgi:predicted DNA-binding protein
MLILHLPREIEERLKAEAKKAGRTKSSFAREVILEKLEDLEDYAIAVERLQTMGKTFSWAEVNAELESLDEADEAAKRAVGQ